MLTNVLVGVNTVVFLIGLYCLGVAVYNFLIGFRGFGKAKRDYPLIKDRCRFLILIAAHNEEAVIASTVENVREVEYDPTLFDVVVVNDNSTDGTAAECERVGVRFITTAEKLFPREGVGKPGGLQYALRALGFEKLIKQYDLVMVLDADNHVSPNLLKELNSQFIGKNRPTVIQSYLDSKNFDHALSRGYATAYVVGNRFFQLAKYRLGLPNAIGGTGFVVRTDYLIESGGFNYKSLTEDLEMEMEVVLQGGQVLWNHFARVYDEKPEDIKVSLRQRTRWMQGHWFVAFTYLIPMVKQFLKEGKWKYIDQLIYLFGGAKVVQLMFMAISFVLSAIGIIVTKRIPDISEALSQGYQSILIVASVYLVLFVYQMVLIPIYAFKEDSRIVFRFFPMLLSSFYYAITFLYCQMIGLLKWRQQHTWVKTIHTVERVRYDGPEEG